MVNYFLIFIIGVASALPAPHNLVHLGDIEGKAFYAEFNLNLNWTNAFAYCEQLELKLARVESLAQAYFLASNLPAYEENWLSIKDINVNSPEITWTWDSAGAHSFDEGMLWTDSGDIELDSYCGVIQNYTNGHPSVSYKRCEDTWPNTICEGVANSSKIPSAVVIKEANKTIQKKKMTRNQNEFIHLGDVEGKSFYYRNPGQWEDFDWLESYEICKENNMTLATITSQAQADLLASSIAQRNWAAVYWIAAGNIPISQQTAHYNSTGVYSWTDYEWILDGRPEPGTWCGAFWCQRCTTTPTPTVNIRSCGGYEPYFICQVEQ